VSSISSVSSGVNPYQNNPSNGFSAIRKDLNALGSALQSGDLSGAQTAFSSLQTDFQNRPQPPSASGATGSTGSASSTNPIQKDLQAVQTALQSGDVDGAKTAFDKLKTDLQQVRGHHGHHHGGGKPPVSSDSPDSAQSGSSSTSTTSSTSSSTTDSLLSTLQTTVASVINQLA